MYYIPQNYKCTKCSSIFKWNGMSECHTFPLDKKPFCPECYLKWVEDNVPQGKIVKQQIAVPTEIIKKG